MPPVPNFDIPDAPSPPAQNSEEAATLAAVAKQFERFLELKKQGIHFNERLQNSTSLRNPSLLPKLMAFAEITEEDCYMRRSSLCLRGGRRTAMWKAWSSRMSGGRRRGLRNGKSWISCLHKLVRAVGSLHLVMGREASLVNDKAMRRRCWR
jgi:hypothetical protein